MPYGDIASEISAAISASVRPGMRNFGAEGMHPVDEWTGLGQHVDLALPP